MNTTYLLKSIGRFFLIWFGGSLIFFWFPMAGAISFGIGIYSAIQYYKKLSVQQKNKNEGVSEYSDQNQKNISSNNL